MKKVFLALVAVMAIGASTTFAQKAIGLRFGGNGTILGGEVTYQQAMGANRLEADFGYRGGENFSHLSVAGIYQWKGTIVGNFNWYAGPGAAVGFYMSDIANASGISLAIGGQGGVEYDFSGHGVPLNISIDARPMFNLVRPSHYNGLDFGACLSIRYLF